jgi:hypothetical protein
MAKHKKDEEVVHEEVVLAADVKKISEAEFERRTKLDVSDSQYMNPSLDHKA